MNILKIEWKTHFKSLLVWSGVVALVWVCSWRSFLVCNRAACKI